MFEVSVIIPTRDGKYKYWLPDNVERIIVDIGKERSRQRNYGARKAKGKYLLFLDDDMQIHPYLIGECLTLIKDYEALYIPEIVVGNEYRNFERSFYNATCIDAIRFIRKDVFERIGGFDERLTGPEDWDLDRQVYYKGITHYSLYHHEEDFAFENYLQSKFYYNKGLRKYKIKWHNDGIVRKQLGFWYRFIGVFTENGKWKQLVLHPFLTMGMYILRFMVGLNALRYSFSIPVLKSHKSL